MDGLLTRDNRVGDAALLGNLERNVSFFASSTLLVLAGLVAAIGSGEDIVAVAENLPFTLAVRQSYCFCRLSLCMFVYAFFKFSWSLR